MTQLPKQTTVRELAITWDCYLKLIIGLQTNTLILNDAHSDHLIECIKQIPVICTTNLKTTAGLAVYPSRFRNTKRHIKLHPGMFDPNDPQLWNDRVNTFLHEIAHHIVHMTGRGKGHDEYWKYCMIHFGLDPSRCYDENKTNYRGYRERKETKEVDDIVANLATIEWNLKS